MSIEAAPVIWITGLPAAGKSTIARELTMRLQESGRPAECLDGDTLRSVFPHTGFSRDARIAHIRWTGYTASLLAKHGVAVVCALISPYASARAEVRQFCNWFVEVYVSTPLEECERRDVKGLYARARRGELAHFTGIDDPYEPPVAPDVIVDTATVSVASSVEMILVKMDEQGQRLHK